jgi:hypothetical protein
MCEAIFRIGRRRHTGVWGRGSWSWYHRLFTVFSLSVLPLDVTIRVLLIVPICDFLEYCWHQNILPKVLNVTILLICSFCSAEGLFGFSCSFRRPIPNGALARRLWLLVSSNGSSSSCWWDCCQQRPSKQIFVQNPLPVVSAAHRF